MGNKLPYLNVGCGYSYHEDWTNIDFVSTGKDVIAHNLLNGIPYPDETFEVVYHSHVLEHFSKQDGEKFIGECYRVLKKGGVLRMAIPDLEKIILEYTQLLSELKLKGNDPYLNASYDWILMELYDQTLRNKSGGQMAEFLQKDKLLNEDFIIKRCGYEAKQIIDSFRQSKNNNTNSKPLEPSGLVPLIKRNIYWLKLLPQKMRNRLRRKILGQQFQYYYEIGKFRSSGEIHQWMYDSFSIQRLLKKSGFRNVQVCSAFDSEIAGWQNFRLETMDGNVRKPDSLFTEAKK